MGRWFIFFVLFFSIGVGSIIYYTMSHRSQITKGIQQEIAVEFKSFLIKKNQGQPKLSLLENNLFFLDLNQPLGITLDGEKIIFYFPKPITQDPTRMASNEIMSAFQKQLFNLAQNWVSLKFPKDQKKIEVQIQFVEK